jgi:hypothetical protein
MSRSGRIYVSVIRSRLEIEREVPAPRALCCAMRSQVALHMAGVLHHERGLRDEELVCPGANAWVFALTQS